MRRFLGILLCAFWVFPAHADFKIVTRRSTANGLHKSQETKYVRGQRLRLEYGPAGATIYQCDLKKQIDLNLSNRLFLPLDLDDDGVPTRSKVPAPPRKAERKIDYGDDYTITLRDTGEKATIFGYPAWHVQMITAAKNRHSGLINETTADYWFIDLKVPERCANFGFDWNDYLLTHAEEMKVKVIGQARRGFAVLTRTVTSSAGKKFESVREVTELVTGELDPQLFEVPKDFRPALQVGEKIYPNIPDTPANRLKANWDRFWEGVAGFIY